MNKFFVTAGLWTLPLLASAQITTECDIVRIIERLRDVFGYLVFVIAIGAILYAAFLFLTSGGNEKAVGDARKALIWGLVGIAVALFASYAVDFVRGIVGGSLPSGC